MMTLFRLPPSLRYFTAILPVLPQALHQNVCFSTTIVNKGPVNKRSYKDALTLLDLLQSNRAIVSSIGNSSREMNALAIPEMLDWMGKAGYEVGDFAKGGLRCIHVAGTKGKGSVCAMVESILAQYQTKDNQGASGQLETGRGLGKIGLYTSPHLLTVRERIRIDGSPISESMFTKYFFELWDRFTEAAYASTPPHPNPTSFETKPGYFRYLTLMAFHTFLQEGVETAIVECGIGGEYDSTNILPAESVTVSAITRLGIDHTGMLGETLEDISWHKGGILKTGVPAYTVEQDSKAQTVLAKRAKDKGVQLSVIPRYVQIENDIKLGLNGKFQNDNASLAAAVAGYHLQHMNITEALPVSDENLPERFKIGLEAVKLPGRCEIRREGNIEWLIDGAHTVDSLGATALWYSEVMHKYQTLSRDKIPPATMLIFNQQDRDPLPLLKVLIGVIKQRTNVRQAFTYAAFCTNTPFKSPVGEGQHSDKTKSPINLQVQEQLAQFYKTLDRDGKHAVYESVQEAVRSARRTAQNIGQNQTFLVLVTGSLHLAGAVLGVLDAGSD